MEQLMTILAAASAISLVQQTSWYEHLALDHKPFNCTLCFGFWSSVWFWFANHGAMGLLYAAMTGVIAELIDRKLNQF